jgi:hypothetical protein
MTTELGNSDASRDAGRRGLSRRQMIKASAVAGAAAWTAPIIIDSLASPAAANSQCQPYWVKLDRSGNCYPQCYDDSVLNFALGGNPPGTGASPDAAQFGGDCSYPGDCGNGDAGNGATRMPFSTPVVTKDSVEYYEVVFSTSSGTGKNCAFSNQTAWQIGGRYEPGNPGSQYKKTAVSCTTSAGPTGGIDGCYWAGTNRAWIRKYYSGNTGNQLNYIYTLFCCPT